MDRESAAQLQREYLKSVHRARIYRNEIELDGFVLKGKKKFQLKYPPDISDMESTDIGLAELTIVMDVIISPIE